ncbi:bifunctional phosphatase PAP2/diacylglycerol kinase family protein [Streptomyces coryli]|uniref:bifunctional phosphatase PAP2/diacylglycerol kinase family protein n=1 Tax=Streptomyces coryli TaxID=1128680 RepID=UPI001F108C33|nr:phosphatase PAP2 family protein [Streptomyces coryli]
MELFHRVAEQHWPGAERVLPRLSRSANHGVLWFALAGAMAAAGGRPARRAALRGAASLAAASATVNTVAKRSVRRHRPLIDAVPVVRRLHRQPFTTSFPSGHSASAAAFAVGAALESRRWGALVAPIAASVAFSRIYTGVHYPSDVLAGAALGAGAAYAVRGMVPTRAQLAPPARPRADAPVLPEGRGLVVVVNSGAGTSNGYGQDVVEQLKTLLPQVDILTRVDDLQPVRRLRTSAARRDQPASDSNDLADLLNAAAAKARDIGGALGVVGGDGSVNSAARAALAHQVPLAVFPGGTRNHFAYDLGIEALRDTATAVEHGEAVGVDVGRFGDEIFVNTFSLGSYPDLVRVRERWAPRIGAWPAGVLAALEVLRAARPVEVEIGGRRRSLWVLFTGNCTYRGLGAMPVRRFDLADGLLDVRVVPAGRLPRIRLLGAALTGPLRGSPLHAATRLRRLRIEGIPADTPVAYDGEVTAAPGELTLHKTNEALTAYRRLDPA